MDKAKSNSSDGTPKPEKSPGLEHVDRAKVQQDVEDHIRGAIYQIGELYPDATCADTMAALESMKLELYISRVFPPHLLGQG